jgi:hypothetical protein
MADEALSNSNNSRKNGDIRDFPWAISPRIGHYLVVGRN